MGVKGSEGVAEADFQFVVFTMLMNTCCRTSADLFKTVFDLLVSVTVFLGRFDMRMMQVFPYLFIILYIRVL